MCHDRVDAGPQVWERRVDAEPHEVGRRVRRYRGGRALPAVTGHDVVLVDDGLATGVTAGAALHALRALRPARLVFGAPVCAPEPARRLVGVTGSVGCVSSPRDFGSLGRWYDSYGQPTDEEVLASLGARAAVPDR